MPANVVADLEKVTVLVLVCLASFRVGGKFCNWDSGEIDTETVCGVTAVVTLAGLRMGWKELVELSPRTVMFEFVETLRRELRALSELPPLLDEGVG